MGTTIGVIRGDTRSLDSSSYGARSCEAKCLLSQIVGDPKPFLRNYSQDLDSLGTLGIRGHCTTLYQDYRRASAYQCIAAYPVYVLIQTRYPPSEVM